MRPVKAEVEGFETLQKNLAGYLPNQSQAQNFEAVAPLTSRLSPQALENKRGAASVTIQRLVRGGQARVRAVVASEKLRFERDARIRSCVAIQAAFRGYAARLQLIRQMFAEACKFGEAFCIYQKQGPSVRLLCCVDTSPDWFHSTIVSEQSY
eukprot:SAG31_NODE_3934_length_3737_cov_14.336998_4_plen_152_part_01